MARSEGLQPHSWCKWRVAGDFEEDLLSFCIRNNRPKTFASLVDLAFIFHWEVLSESDRALFESAFEIALSLADTIWRLDVVPEAEPEELVGGAEDKKRRQTGLRRDELMMHLTRATVAYLRRVPEVAREDELARLERMPFLDQEIVVAIKEANALADSDEFAEAMDSLESKSRNVTSRLTL